MKALLMSIKPEYAERIISGTKKYEYRKRLAKEDVSLMYIYCTFPLMKVVASVNIVGRLSASPTDLWEITKDAAGISELKYSDYFGGCEIAYAYELGEVNIFKSNKLLSDFGVATAPQSYVYIEEQTVCL